MPIRTRHGAQTWSGYAGSSAAINKTLSAKDAPAVTWLILPSNSKVALQILVNIMAREAALVCLFVCE